MIDSITLIYIKWYYYPLWFDDKESEREQYINLLDLTFTKKDSIDDHDDVELPLRPN